MLLDFVFAVWNHPQGRALMISALVSVPVYVNTPVTRDLIWRFGPTVIVVLGIALATLPSGDVKRLAARVAELERKAKRRPRR